MIDTYTNQQPATAKQSNCGCQGAASPPESCCGLVCFERPNYFCGHLLTGEDLSLEQRYTIEKNKLRNRTLAGNGVVCGLRMTCDPCAGWIRIGDGYAIDDCGNDLVVCAPARLNVIQTLIDKNWLIVPEKLDRCKDEKPKRDCPQHQCFHVVACYSEEQSDYTTPFTPGCQACCRP